MSKLSWKQTDEVAAMMTRAAKDHYKYRHEEQAEMLNFVYKREIGRILKENPCRYRVNQSFEHCPLWVSRGKIQCSFGPNGNKEYEIIVCEGCKFRKPLPEGCKQK